MSPIGTPVPGAFPLTSPARLPNVTIAYPGERWSDRKASGAIVPGTCVVPVASGGALLMRAATKDDNLSQAAVASRTIDVPDTNPGSIYQEALGPNEIRNLPIKHGDYVLALYSGVLHLALIVPDTYAPGDLISWDPDGDPQTGKGASGSGAWAKDGADMLGPLFEVQLWRPVNDSSTEGVLTVRSLRGQGPF